MDDSGVDYFRINLSHTNIDDLIPILKFEKLDKNLYAWTRRAQLRTSLLCNEIIAKEHEIIEFVPKKINEKFLIG